MKKHALPSDEPLTLSPRLLELLAAVVQLETDDNDRLAGHLGVSPQTVRTQWKRINERLGTHSKLEAVLHALRRGWIVLEPLPNGGGAENKPKNNPQNDLI